jgi:hypothetical protein
MAESAADAGTTTEGTTTAPEGTEVETSEVELDTKTDNADILKQAARKWEGRANKDKARADALAAKMTELEGKSQKQLDSIAVALGLKKEEATVEDLSKALTESTGKISAAEASAKAANIKLGVFTAATSVEGAEPAKLLDSISFMKKADALDPASDKFNEEMAKLVKENTKTASGGSSGGFSTPVGGGAPQGSGSNETDPRKLADRIAKASGFGMRSL